MFRLAPKRIFGVVVILVCLSSCSKSNNAERENPFVPMAPLPPLPEWVEAAPPVPDWWTNVAVSYDEGAPLSKKWSKVMSAESNIVFMVRSGSPPTKEREALIKYLTAFSQSPRLYPQTRTSLDCQIAGTYESLGDYKWAAKYYADLVSDSPEDVIIYSLALEYERLGDCASALKLYEFMSKSFETNEMGYEIGMRGIACLTGTNSSIWDLKKPDWWSRYDNLPDWWPTVKVELPNFTSWEDGDEYIANKIWNKGDKRATIKAHVLLSKFEPMTFNEEESSLLSIAHAYLDAGDHYRAIETWWQIPKQFPNDPLDTITAFEFLASEFNKLGDAQDAAIMNGDLSRLESAATKAGLSMPTLRPSFSSSPVGQSPAKNRSL